jgi:hypothetical protein
MDPQPLLDRVCGDLTDTALRRIAEADYGWNAQKNAQSLRSWLRHRDLTVPPKIYPSTLQLVTYSEPGDPDWAGHNTRLFCCVLLAGAFPKNDGDYDTLAQLGTSAYALGREHVRAARDLMAWRATRVPGPGVDLLAIVLDALAGQAPAEPPALPPLPRDRGVLDGRWGWLVRKAIRELPEEHALRAAFQALLP